MVSPWQGDFHTKDGELGPGFVHIAEDDEIKREDIPF
jgi:hypothetical protein